MITAKKRTTYIVITGATDRLLYTRSTVTRPDECDWGAGDSDETREGPSRDPQSSKKKGGHWVGRLERGPSLAESTRV